MNDDQISRAAAIDTLRNINAIVSPISDDVLLIDKAEAMTKLMLLPPAQPQRTGRWIDGKCNKCGTHAPYWAMASTYYLSEYCPHCGVYMVTEEEI